MKTKHLSTGKAGERIAREYLEDKAYNILETNWRFSRAEIDLIVSKSKCLVFVEVKTRTSTSFGTPESFVNKRKKQLLVDAANAYLNEIEYAGEFRFDIIGILMKNENEYRLKHLKDAFFPGFEGFM